VIMTKEHSTTHTDSNITDGIRFSTMSIASDPNRPHSALVVSEWEKLSRHLKNLAPIIVDGSSLDMATTVAVGRHGIRSILLDDPVGRDRKDGTISSDGLKILDRIDHSVQFLDKHLAEGNTVYGINTGFGGSADVRCGLNDVHALQLSLLQHLHCGVLSLPQTGRFDGTPDPSTGSTMSMPEDWVRATMLVRANTLARGHSAVRVEVIESLLDLIHYNIVPVVPLRGSISASGDLSPLSYIAGVLNRNPGIYVWTGEMDNKKNPRRIVSASAPLTDIPLPAITLGPKEALGLVNGTAVSCAVASLTLHSIHNLVSLSQVLTAMGVEAILGTATSFAPFISTIRPHPGQTEVAANILSFLFGSKLASGIFGVNPTATQGLYQDRYSIRTVPQWLGPFVEDLLLAHQQISTELNSTTDNPLIDAVNGHVYHGGNFQAVSVASAMEKARLAAQAIGRMLFCQCTELLNPATNRGLPPSLCADNPSLSFTMKGLDTSMASYMSELSFLANPVHNHVVNAEMGNQSLNSLALISARYTDTAVEILQLMAAVYLYALCQALDLRKLQIEFETDLRTSLEVSVAYHFGGLGPTRREELCSRLSEHIKKELRNTTKLDLEERFTTIMTSAQTVVLAFFEQRKSDSPSDLPSSLTDFRTRAARATAGLYDDVRSAYFANGDATPVLGRASQRLYNFVRKDLHVPMHRGLVDDPGYHNPKVEEADDDKWRKKTVGHWVGVIYRAIKEGAIMDVVVECLKDGDGEKPSTGDGEQSSNAVA
jgi:phenylalanine ammonia-lyase